MTNPWEDARAALNEEGFFNREQARIVSALITEHESLTRAMRATDDFRIADWLKLEAERDAAEAEVERLTTPPTDDEREALIAEVTTTLLDRIGAQRLSADLVRGVVTEWERRAGFRRQGPITDAMADAANQEWHDFVWGPEEPLSQRDLGITRQAWKAALEAAERARG